MRGTLCKFVAFDIFVSVIGNLLTNIFEKGLGKEGVVGLIVPFITVVTIGYLVNLKYVFGKKASVFNFLKFVLSGFIVSLIEVSGLKIFVEPVGLPAELGLALTLFVFIASIACYFALLSGFVFKEEKGGF